MIIDFNKYQLITEDPDGIYIQKKGKEIYMGWRDQDARPIGCLTNDDQSVLKELKIGKIPGKMHSESGIGSGSGYSYPGRFWLKHKIISFWVYPNSQLFKQMIKELEKQLNIKIFNDGWKIEVLETTEGEIRKRKIGETEDDFYFDDRENSDKLMFIPIEEYVGSENFSEEQKMLHLMNWREKESAMKKIKGFGSDKTASDQPRNLKWRQTIYQENKKE